MRDENGIVWLTEEVYLEMLAESERAFPFETGGVLIGYWVKAYREVVITGATGPGPKAIHEWHKFLPDGEYQEAEIARLYHESGRLHTYLGDWHSHCHESPYMSMTDRSTLHKIATYPEARAPVPLMAIFGESPAWLLKVWRYIPTRFSVLRLGIKTVELKIRFY